MSAALILHLLFVGDFLILLFSGFRTANSVLIFREEINCSFTTRAPASQAAYLRPVRDHSPHKAGAKKRALVAFSASNSQCRRRRDKTV